VLQVGIQIPTHPEKHVISAKTLVPNYSERVEDAGFPLKTVGAGKLRAVFLLAVDTIGP
jgi:hypothetical protein